MAAAELVDSESLCMFARFFTGKKQPLFQTRLKFKLPKMILFWEPVCRYYHTPLISLTSVVISLGWLVVLIIPLVIAFVTEGKLVFVLYQCIILKHAI